LQVSRGRYPELPGMAPDGRRNDLRALLESHRPVDARESLSVEIMAAELDRLADPFDREADPTHVTASAVVVGPRGVVLHRHRRLRRWLQPGGHIDPGERPEDAAVRETVEETGLAVSHPPTGPAMVHVDVHRAARGHVHLDLRYLLRGVDADPAPAPGESQEVGWFSWDEAMGRADAALAGALVAARSLIRSPGGLRTLRAREEWG
jgi:8-oxo-dGTP pyrophosphatase MutT (NUDIX family)